MKSTVIRWILGICLVALASTSVWAIPPYCTDICFSPSTRWCYQFPYGTMQCSQWCAIEPDLCGPFLTAEPSFDLAACDATVSAPEPAQAVVSEEAVLPDNEPAASI